MVGRGVRPLRSRSAATRRAASARPSVPKAGWFGSRKKASEARAGGNGTGAPADVMVPIPELMDTTRRAIMTYGYDEREAQVLLDVMMYAQLRGNNQGIIKVTTKGIARQHKGFTATHETPLSAVLDGQQDSGMLVLSAGVDMAVSKARQSGFGIVGTNNTCTSTGALGYYAGKVAEAGMIGVCLAQSPEFVAPHGAKEAIFGTNPIGVAVPSSRGPMVMDMATSAYAFFGLLEAKTAGKPIPGDVAIDKDGNPTTDPQAAIEGAIRVFDRSYKGSNLALAVELLAGPLVGAAIKDKLAAKSWGNLVCAIDPGLLAGDGFEDRAAEVLERVKNAARMPGVEEITLPGERGDKVAAERMAAGVTPIEPNLWAGLQELAATYTGPPPSAAAPAPPPLAAAPVSYGGSGSGAKMATRIIHPSAKSGDPYGATNAPLYQTATFAQPSATTFGEYDYNRSGNPTRTLLEEQMAELEGADGAYAFGSGMAALAAVTRLVANGERIVAGDDIYGGTSRLLMDVVPKQGIEVVNVDMTDLGAVKAAITKNTKMVMLESPTNPRMEITDIASISKMAKEVGAIVVVDNSIMAPVFQCPLALGADISMTSATKFIAGHSQVTGGILAVKGEQLCKDVYFIQNAEGGGLGPFDCWLCLLGIKTMALRMQKQQENCQKIAEFLEKHPLVKKVNYPGLASHPGYELHNKQASGAGSLLSFSTGSLEASKIIVEDTKFFKITVSFGNTTSLISLPCFMSHASIPAEVREARGLPDDLVRISAGIEDADDLIADLDAAMSKAMAAVGMRQPPAAAGAGDREEELLRRIAELEARMAAAGIAK